MTLHKNAKPAFFHLIFLANLYSKDVGPCKLKWAPTFQNLGAHLAPMIFNKISPLNICVKYEVILNRLNLHFMPFYWLTTWLFGNFRLDVCRTIWAASRKKGPLGSVREGVQIFTRHSVR